MYYLLALQNWCTTNYLIHGLWSDYTPTSYPSFCSDIPFSLDELTKSPVYDDLLLNWNDCNYNDTITLYEHEWLKHGTCFPQFSQNEYFEKALTLYKQYAHDGNGSAICFDTDFVKIDCPKA
jgi:ribonuclease I